MSDPLTAVGTVGTVVAAGAAARSIPLPTRHAKANAEAIYRERRIDFDLERPRELIESIEKGPSVAFATAKAQTALRMLGREHALPFARTQYSVDPTDQNRDALDTWRAAHPAHPAMHWDTVQPVMRDEAHPAVQVALSRRPTEPSVSERLARRPWRTLWLVRR